jgi:hypothetical protein
MIIDASININSIDFTINNKHLFKCKLINDISNLPKYQLIKDDVIQSHIYTKHKFPLKIYFELDIHNQIIKLEQKGSFLKPFYGFNYNGDQYEIFLHKKPRLSIYKNKTQVASYESKYYKLTTRIVAKIMLDNKYMDPILLCTIISALEFPKNDGLSGMLFEKKAFNPNWKPQNQSF